jgi:glycosyltransferase involved in cell wall biosynthesis
MRHSALTLADQVATLVQEGERWDVLFASDMLPLAEFRSLAPAKAGRLPAVAYFHENQFTYPVQAEHERDFHFAMTNLTTALAADEVWFNSAFHRDEMLAAVGEFLQRMPDHRQGAWVEVIRAKSRVQPPGVRLPADRPPREAGPLRILWAARWEYDKDPAAFFAALGELATRGVDFRVSVIGQSFRETPPEFAQARARLAPQLDHWGFLEDRAAYDAALLAADVIVSTARHEFFGLSVVEAMAAGALPVLPNRLSYPEILGAELSELLYDGPPTALAGRLAKLSSQRTTSPDSWAATVRRVQSRVRQYHWPQRAAAMDEALEVLGRV